MGTSQHIAILSPNAAFSALVELILDRSSLLSVSQHAHVAELAALEGAPALIVCNFELDSGFYQRFVPTAARLKREARTKVLATVRDLDGWQKQACLSLGIDEVLVKPVSPLHLSERIIALAGQNAANFGGAEIIPFPRPYVPGPHPHA